MYFLFLFQILGIVLSSLTKIISGSTSLPKPLGKALLLYPFETREKINTNKIVVSSIIKTFLVIEKSKGFGLVGWFRLSYLIFPDTPVEYIFP